jgi:hypothetical protein
MEYITNTLRTMFGFSNKKEISGYVLSADEERTMLIVKEGEHYWTVKSYNHNEYSIKPIPYESKSSLFGSIFGDNYNQV